MGSFNVLLSLLVLTLVRAQTPTDAPFPTTNHLGITFANNFEISPSGLLVDRHYTMHTPHLHISPNLLTPHTAYIILAVDLNVLRNITIHTTLLHWFATGLTQPYCTSSTHTKDIQVPIQPGPTTLDIPGSYYLGPNPPAGTGTHRYVFWLFEQPANYTVPIEYCLINPPAIPPPNSGRLVFNIIDFAQKTGLGYPIAGNYFRITAEPAAVPQNPPNTLCNGQLP